MLDGVDHGPTGFHHVLPGVERGVADDDVEQQRFVSRGRAFAEAGTVIEVHGDGPQLHARAGTLGEKLERNAFFRLDAQDQQIGRGCVVPSPSKMCQRRGVELDGDLGDALGQALAGAQIERHAGPAPVVHEEA